MGRLTSLLLKAIGVLVLALVALSVVATIVGIALSLVVAVLSVLVTLAVVGAFVLALVGVGSLLRRDSSAAAEPNARSRPADRVDAEDRLRSRYVDGELDDIEFERELERVLEPDRRRGRRDGERRVARDPATERGRLSDR